MRRWTTPANRASRAHARARLQVDWEPYWRNPHEFGKFKAVQQRSGCGRALNAVLIAESVLAPPKAATT